MDRIVLALALAAASPAQAGWVKGPPRPCVTGIPDDAIKVGNDGTKFIMIVNAGEQRSFNCGGMGLTIVSKGSRLRADNCANVLIRGSNTSLETQFYKSGTITVKGNDNSVAWNALGKAVVTRTDTGTGNSFVKADLSKPTCIKAGR